MQELEFTVTVEEANLILEGLGTLPFAKVFQLVAKIQDQARRQLNGPADLAAAPEAEETGKKRRTKGTVMKLGEAPDGD